MSIASLDIATRLTGWCAGSGADQPAVGAWEFPQVGNDLGELLYRLDEYLSIMHGRFLFTHLVYEAPILVIRGRGKNGPQRTDKLEVVRKLYAMGGHVEFFCRTRGIKCAEVSLQAIKKEVTGNASAEKKDIVAAARRCGVRLPNGPGVEDAADAWGGWLLALRAWAPEHSRRWDRAVFSMGRANLL